MRLLLVLLAALASFFAPNVYSSCITLTWTASGDDGYVGVAYKYDLRYSVTYMTDQTWEEATAVPCAMKPGEAGQHESFRVGDLEPGQMYYFGLRVCDEAGNWSSLSNVIAKIAPADRCTGTVGNVDCGEDDAVSIADVAVLIEHLFMGGPLCCSAEANVNDDPNGVISISDISAIIDHLFISQMPLPQCSL